jgi:hypothetical protein
VKIVSVLVLGVALSACVTNVSAGEPREKSRDNKTTTLFRLLGKNAIWTPVQTVNMNFQTFHTQGLVKIGDTFFVSSVEVLESTVRNGAATDALYDFTLDRSTGNGRGWVFKFDASGQLLGKVELTDGTKFHPGGMDYDGKSLWVPVAEYRPNSASNVYRINPKTLKAELMFTEKDHIGGVVHDVHDRSIRGVSWGSRRLYTWELSKGRHGPVKVSSAISSDWVPNPQFTIDYQDCHYQGVDFMLCGGVASYNTPRGNVAFGGLDLVDLRRNRMEHQVPVNLFIDEGAGATGTLALTHNAFWVEPLDKQSLRGFFMTESDNQAELVIYDVTPWINRD